MSDWVRSQSKMLRPYFGAIDAEDLLDGLELVLRIGEASIQTKRIIVDDGQMRNMAPLLYPNLSEERISSVLGQNRSAFDLIVTLRTPQMLRRELVARYSLDGGAPNCVEIPDEMLKDARLTGLFELGVSICLAKETSLGLGWPSQVGSWIAREVYRIGYDRRQPAFRIRPLTDELIATFGLPKGTFVYVDVDDLNVEQDEDMSCATAYVSQRLLNGSVLSKSNAALNSLIWSDVICGILLADSNGISDAQEVTSGSPLEAILENLRSDSPIKLMEMKELIRDPIRLRATVHDCRGLVKDLETV